ncbi:MAG: hypothetical protein ACM31D_04585 [Bacteroidota bacterium]
MTFAPLTALPQASLRRSWAAFVSQVMSTLDTTDVTWLIEVDAYTGQTGSNRLPGAAWGSGPVASMPLGSRLDTGLATLRYSDTGWIGEPGDPLMPNVPYWGRLAAPPRFSRSMPVLPEQTRRLQAQYGEATLSNGDGLLDSVVSKWAVSGRRIRVLRGRRTVPYHSSYNSFVTTLDVVGVDWQADGMTARIGLRDRAWRLEVPLQQQLYLGTGGAEGGTELKGKSKPITMGIKRNIRPDLVDTANLVFKVHDGKINALLAVRDRAVPIADAGVDHASYAALVAASITAGTFHTCKAEGLFRVAFLTDGALVTCDVEGDVFGGVYTNTHAGIAQRLMLTRAGLPAADVDAGSFAALPSGPCGFHWGSDRPVTAAQALDEVLSSCGGWWGQDRYGTTRAGRLAAPAGTPVLEIVPKLMRGEPSRVALSEVPRYRQRVAYRPLGIVQTGADVADTVSQADRLLYGESWQVVTAYDGAVQARYPQADDRPPLVSGFDAESDGQALADYLHALHKADRRMFRVPLGPSGYATDLGNIVSLEYPRHDLASAPSFVVVGVDEDGDNVTLTLWG